MNTLNATNHWPRTGSLLFVAAENNNTKAYDFAKSVLCPLQHDLALWEGGTHPDFKMIQPEDSRTIKIDQIRSLNDWAHEKPSIAATKVAILDPADALNIQAANALLKTLEEPSLATLFILITAYPQRLLPTLRSRCHIIRDRTDYAPSETAEIVLKEEVMRDLMLLEQGKMGPTTLAETWSKKDIGRMLYWVVVYLNEAIKKSIMQGHVIRNKAWWALYDHAMQAKKMLDDKSPVNTLLLIEALLINFVTVKER